MTSSLTLASQTIGFISFSITLLTLLGVYRDLISTLRSAPTQIPLLLGNLRQEILAERTYLRQRCREGRDPFGVFPARLAGLPSGAAGGGSGSGKGRSGKRGSDISPYVRLLEVTVKDLWLEFRMLERPFLVGGGLRAEAIAKGDYWGEEDVEAAWGSGADEKDEATSRGGGGVRRRRRSGRGGGGTTRRRPRSDREEWEAAEEDLRREGAKYYNTNFAHRFIWWQTKGDVMRLADQVQRIQIRRMERDLFETDELVRILIRGAGLGNIGVAGRPGGSGPYGSGSESDSVDGGGDGGGRRSSAVVRSRPTSRAPPSRRGSTNYREVEEREVVRRGGPGPPPSSSSSPPRPQPRPRTQQSDHEANVAARRTERRRSGPRVEYEVLRPGSGGYVVVNDTYERPPPRRRSVYEEDPPQESRRRSYSRRRDSR